MFMMVGSTASAQGLITTAPRTKINFVGLDRSTVLKGSKQTFYLTSEGAEDVQYRIWIRYPGTNDWEDITKGYTDKVKAKDLYAVTPEKILDEGAFYGSVWVKKAGEKGKQSNDKGDFDSYYKFTFDVKEKGENLAKDIKIDKEECILGDTITVDGRDEYDIAEYKLHAYDVKNNRWLNNIDGYKKMGLKWTPQHTGKYMLDVWVRKAGKAGGGAKWQEFILKPIEVKAGADGKTELPGCIDDITGKITQEYIDNYVAKGRMKDNGTKVVDNMYHFNGTRYGHTVKDKVLGEKFNPKINQQMVDLTQIFLENTNDYLDIYFYKDNDSKYDAGMFNIYKDKNKDAHLQIVFMENREVGGATIEIQPHGDLSYFDKEMDVVLKYFTKNDASKIKMDWIAHSKNSGNNIGKEYENYRVFFEKDSIYISKK